MDAQKYPYYCINLKRSTARRAKMEATYKKFGLYYQFVPAVDGRALNPDTYSHMNLKLNETACMISHFKAISRAFFDGVPIAIVQEDDTSFDLMACWVHSLTEVIEGAPADWDILHVSAFYKGARPWKGQLKFLKWSKEVIASTYIINRRGMEKVVNALKFDGAGNLQLPVDGCDVKDPLDICLYEIVNTYVPNLIMFIPYNGQDIPSDIHGFLNTDMWAEKKATLRCIKEKQLQTTR